MPCGSDAECTLLTRHPSGEMRTDSDYESDYELSMSEIRIPVFYNTCASVFFADNDPKGEVNDGSDKHSYGTTDNYFCIPNDACD